MHKNHLFRIHIKTDRLERLDRKDWVSISAENGKTWLIINKDVTFILGQDSQYIYYLLESFLTVNKASCI